MSYKVKDTFRTIQGEGFHAGTPAFFIRFAGCNMWNGNDADRARDAARNQAECPKWCDTDFVGGLTYTAEQLAEMVARAAMPLVVLTGGEPCLQVDNELLLAIHEAAPITRIAIETNGATLPMFYESLQLSRSDEDLMGAGWLWITMSPKRPREKTVLLRADEIKLVVPAYRVDDWSDFNADHFFVQPQADRAIRDTDCEQRTADILTMVAGKWRLSLQTHKILEIP